MEKKQKRLGQVLIDKGLITAGQLEEALEEQKATKDFLGNILLRREYIKEKDLQGALSELFDMPLISLKNRYIDWNFVKAFSASLILDYKCFPVEEGDKHVTIAITNPLDVWARKKCEEETKGLKLRLVLTSQEDIREAISRYKEYLLNKISGLLR